MAYAHPNLFLNSLTNVSTVLGNSILCTMYFLPSGLTALYDYLSFLQGIFVILNSPMLGYKY